MDYLWKKFEEEFNREFSTSEKGFVLSQAVREFLARDLRTFEENGVTYIRRPEEFREALLRRIIKGGIKNGFGKGTPEQ